MPEFKDIRIVEGEECTTHDLPVEQQFDEHRGTPPLPPSACHRSIHLKLSANPPQVWQNMFDSIWGKIQHVQSLRCPAKIEDDCMVVKTSDVELKIHHLLLLKQAVENANVMYRET